MGNSYLYIETENRFAKAEYGAGYRFRSNNGFIFKLDGAFLQEYDVEKSHIPDRYRAKGILIKMLTDKLEFFVGGQYEVSDSYDYYRKKVFIGLKYDMPNGHKIETELNSSDLASSNGKDEFEVKYHFNFINNTNWRPYIRHITVRGHDNPVQVGVMYFFGR